MSRYLMPLIFAVIGLIPAVGVGFAYANGRIGTGTLAFLELSVLTLAVVVFIFVRKMNNPSESMEQTIYKADHPTR